MKISIDFEGNLRGRPKYDVIETEHRFQLGEKLDYCNDQGTKYYGIVDDIELHHDAQLNKEELFLTIKLDD